MTIVDALTKAKKRQQEARLEETERSGSRPARKSFVPNTMESLPPTTIQATVVKADMAACRRNRVIYPGKESFSDVKAESALRMLRTRVLHRVRAEQWTTIGITSPTANTGKTLTSVNLALRIAQEKNADVFLLDLDMRNPSVCATLGVEPREELREFFEDIIPADNLFISIGVERFLFAGSIQPSSRSSELLSNAKFEDLVAQIKSASSNPLILIDLPPVLSTDDALVLAPRLDAILMVAAEGKTTRDELKRAVDVLSEFKIAGFVLNRSRSALQESYGYY